MNPNNFVRITLMLFVFIVVFDILLHNFLLTPFYLETQEHWRSLADFKDFAFVFFLGKLVIAAVFAAMYLQFRRTGTHREGLTFGLLVGGLFAGRYMISFATENLFTLQILLSWIALYALLEHAIAGVISSRVYKPVTKQQKDADLTS